MPEQSRSESSTPALRRPKPASDKVLVGRDGWLFLQNDRNDVIGQHSGRVRFSAESLDQWRAVISDRLRVSDELGVTWICSVVPDKEAVYAELLPAGVVPAERRPVHDLLDLGHDLAAPIDYLLEPVRSALGGLPLYALTGTHWNHLGAYQAYRSVCDRLVERGEANLRVVDEDAVRWSKIRRAGDLGSKLASPRAGLSVRARIPRARGELIFDNRVHNHGRTVVFEQDAPELPTCVVFGESFTNYLLIFLKESFRRTVFVHTSSMAPEILNWEEPDVVLSFPTERFLIRPPSTDDNAWAELIETVETKRRRKQIRPHAEEWFLGTRGYEQEYLRPGILPWDGGPAEPRDRERGRTVALTHELKMSERSLRRLSRIVRAHGRGGDEHEILAAPPGNAAEALSNPD